MDIKCIYECLPWTTCRKPAFLSGHFTNLHLDGMSFSLFFFLYSPPCDLQGSGSSFIQTSSCWLDIVQCIKREGNRQPAISVSLTSYTYTRHYLALNFDTQALILLDIGPAVNLKITRSPETSIGLEAFRDAYRKML